MFRKVVIFSRTLILDGIVRRLSKQSIKRVKVNLKMSKRKRAEGPTLVSAHRPLSTVSGSYPGVETSVGSILGKRALFEPPDCPNKRSRAQLSEEISGVLPEESSSKRSADFDIEIGRLHKRLRATVPSAEEAIAFFLPHMLEMRRLYSRERHEKLLLKETVEELRRNNEVLTLGLRGQLSQKNLIQRQLEMAQYRLAMTSNVLAYGNSF